MEEGDKSSRGSIVLVVVVIIIIILLWLLVPNLSKIIDPGNGNGEPKIFEVFEEFKGENTIVYKNEALNVSLTRDHNPRRNVTSYIAEWIDIWGNSSAARGGSPETLFDEILREAQDMTVDQIRWYEFMIQEIIE